MKIPCLTIRIDGDDLVVLYAGNEKSKALEIAKAEVNKPHKSPAEYRVVQAVGAGIAWRRSVKPSEDVESDADTNAIRAALKEKGVKLPPRIGVDKLLDLAVKHGVEV